MYTLIKGFVPYFVLITVFSSRTYANVPRCTEVFQKEKRQASVNDLFKSTVEGVIFDFNGYRFETVKGSNSEKDFSLDPYGTFEYKILIFDQLGIEVGRLYAAVGGRSDGTPTRENAEFYIRLPESLKRQGLSRAFIQKFLDEYKIKHVLLPLELDNFDSFLIGKERGLSDVDALAQTHFGKVFFPLGFKSTMIEPDYSLKEITVEIVREDEWIGLKSIQPSLSIYDF